SGDYLEFLTNEIRTALSKVTKQNLEKIIIAYEPVWAIGKSERDAMSPNLIHEMTIFIKKTLSDLYGQEEISKVPILYGGSVGPTNVRDIMTRGEVSGLLVGRQSLDADAFKEILGIVNSN
ncbi:triose-phosphate isomerase, partial [Candidatus Parcubacteria bacterium]|nr:triose-phosphate isomerase [Candidatus Parcubacteria bacterium]